MTGVFDWIPGELPPVRSGLVVAGTGHRPGAPGLVAGCDIALESLASAAVTVLRPSRVISGFALGWDLALARAALATATPVTAALPFGHAVRAAECRRHEPYVVRGRLMTCVESTRDGIRFDHVIWSQGPFRTAICVEPHHLPLFEIVFEVGEQTTFWPVEQRRRYLATLGLCDDIVVVSPGGYAAHKMLERNKWMVSRGEAVLALWSGRPGGTSHCVAAALEAGRDVLNLWKAWSDRPSAPRWLVERHLEAPRPDRNLEQSTSPTKSSVKGVW